MIIGELDVQKTKSKNKWRIQKKNNNNNNVFWKYINYDNVENGNYMKNNKVTVKAVNVLPLVEFLKKNISSPGANIYLVSKMLADISVQLNYLDIHQKTLLYLETSNIMVIVYNSDGNQLMNDGSNVKFIYASTEALVHIDKSLTDNVIVNIPYLKTQYISPELHSLYTLPGYIHKSCSYYSLVLIGVVMLIDHRMLDLPANKNMFRTPMTKNRILEHIEEIKPAKLYYLIERAVENDPKKRAFLYV
tara:strand:- start:84 stop:824 length:741 start_codon:yes stop_codon:yes gene_type:complete